MKLKTPDLQIVVISLKEEFYSHADALIGIAPDPQVFSLHYNAFQTCVSQSISLSRLCLLFCVLTFALFNLNDL